MTDIDQADLTAVADDINTYRELDHVIKDLRERQQTLRSRIEDALGDCETGVVDGQPVVKHSFVKTRRFDQSAFKKAHPELAAEFVTVTESRRFTVVSD